MSRCGWNECPEGLRKRKTMNFAPGCPECRERRREAMARHRKRMKTWREDVKVAEEEGRTLGDYIIERDAAGNLLPPRPRKEGVPEFTEVWLG